MHRCWVGAQRGGGARHSLIAADFWGPAALEGHNNRLLPAVITRPGRLGETFARAFVASAAQRDLGRRLLCLHFLLSPPEYGHDTEAMVRRFDHADHRVHGERVFPIHRKDLIQPDNVGPGGDRL